VKDDVVRYFSNQDHPGNNKTRAGKPALERLYRN
jgi:hypothetical protein